MSLNTLSLGGLQLAELAQLAEGQYVTLRTGPGDDDFVNVLLGNFRTYMTALVNERIDNLDIGGGSAPSIWPAQRTISLSGPVTGSASFDGSSNFTVATSIADGALSIAKISGLEAALSAAASRENQTFTGTTILTGDLIPSEDNMYSLGSEDRVWRDVYIGPGSLYINGQKVLEENSGTIRMIADPNQNIAIQTAGAGDIELAPTGTGVIQLKGALQLQGGSKIRTANGLALMFDEDVQFDRPVRHLSDAKFMSGQTEVWAVSDDGSPKYVYKSELGTLLASALYHRTGAWVGFRRFNPTTGATEGELAVHGDRVTYNGSEIYHAGNLVPGALGYLNAPVTEYGESAGVNCNSFVAGTKHLVHNANLNTPGTGALHWYVETLRINAGEGAGLVLLQRAWGTNADEFYFRRSVGGSWSAWRRSWNAGNFTPSNKLDSNANAVSASKWAVERTLALTGAVTGSVSWDGSGNATLATTSALTTADVSGLTTALNDRALKAQVVQMGTSGQHSPVFNGDLNTVSGTSAFYAGTGSTNSPRNSQILSLGIADYHTQLSLRGDHFAFRSQEAGVWGQWRDIYHSGNLDLSSYVSSTRSISAGNGLSGGGDLSANRTISLGTPSAINPTSTNGVTSGSHTHSLTMTWGEGSALLSSLPSTYPSNVLSLTRVGAAAGTGWPEYGVAATFATNTSRAGQLYFGGGNNKLWFRSQTTSDAWGELQEVFHSGNQFALGATQATARTALGLGSAALSNTSDFVTTSGNQTGIGGSKTWTGPQTITGASIILQGDANRHLYFQDANATNRGLIFSEATSRNLILRRYNSAGVTEGQLIIGASEATYNNNTLVHSGNIADQLGSNVVNTTSAQNVGGAKTFTSAISVGDTFDNRIYLLPRSGTSNPSVAINYSAAGNLGFYDTTNSTWLFRVDVNKNAFLGGDMTISGALAMGSSTAPGGAGDFSKHIQLHSSGYGFTVTSNRLNYRADSSANSTHVFSINSQDRLWVSDTLMTFGSDADTTSDTKIVRVISNGYGGFVANGDVGNISGEPGGSFFAATLDGSAHTGGTTLLMSMINTAGEDGSGGTWTGTTSNSGLIAVRGNYRLQFGSNNEIAFYVQGSNAVFNGTISDSLGNLRTAIDGKVDTGRTITAGNGLSGGGTLAANRTITLGTPGSLTNDTTDSVTTSSHTHNVQLEALWHQDDRSGTIRTTPDTYRPRHTSVAFNSGANVGLSSTYATTWTNFAWTQYNASYRPTQLIFPGDGTGIYFRRAASATAWDTMYKIYTEADPVVLTSTTISAGNGLSGGGTLAANRTITLGTPGTISPTTTNSVTTASHTHNLDLTANYPWTGTHTFAQKVTITGGLQIANFIAPSTGDVTGHLQLHASSGGYGLNITSNTLNVVVAGTSRIAASTTEVTVNHPLFSTGNIMCGGTVGFAGLAGTTTSGRTGFVAFYNTSGGARAGYIGYATSTAIQYVAEGGRTHSFNADVSATDFVLSSDRRLKKDIRPLTIEGDKWLMPKTYFHLETEREEDGFIAQDVQRLYPRMVSKRGDGKLQVRYSRITAALARQDLVLRDELKAQRKLISEQAKAIAKLTKLVQKLAK